MAHIVTAPLAVVTDSNGRSAYVYEGSPLPDGLRDEEVERLVELGLVSKVDDPTPVAGIGDAPAESAPRRSSRKE